MTESTLVEIARRHGLDAAALDELLAAISLATTSSPEVVSSDQGTSTLLGDDLDGEAPRPAEPTGRRYVDLGPIASGGTAEVRRARDLAFDRTVAMKVLRATHANRPQVVARFLQEARITAQLQHPSIPAIYDRGQLADGRPFFTMVEIRGHTLARAIREAEPGVPRSLIEALRAVCATMAYAHERGVVHRDLKPENVMLGPFGEVLVVDWGIARVLDDARPRSGAVVGTPAYMSPEQARGDVEVDARSDVYSLGAILYEVLARRAPYKGRGQDVIQRVLSGPPPPLPAHLPEELAQLCERAMSPAVALRPDAATLATELGDWLDGARRRERALAVVVDAEQRGPEAAAMRTRAAELRAEAEARLATVPPWAPEGDKAAAWDLEDAAGRLERDADLAELENERLLEDALVHEPDLEEAHAALAERWRRVHAQAEDAADRRGLARAEVQLRKHLAALQPEHPTRRRGTAWLGGEGALTLVTDPPGATVDLYAYETVRRRLVPVFRRSLGVTPLRDEPLPMGSWLCVIRAPGHEEVRYPVQIGRQERWDGVPPGATSPHPVRLPRQGELGPDERYVPAGWFWSGGDPEAIEPLPRRRLWADAFVVERHAVTGARWLAFLEHLAATGREDELERAIPRVGEPTVRRDGARFVMDAVVDGIAFLPEWPVCGVDWLSAFAFAAWHAERAGLPWRLPGELEREKASRGVDARIHPWGDFIDPSWACTKDGSPQPRPSLPDAFPVDESPYGARGLAGHVREWCADAYQRSGPAVVDSRFAIPTEPSTDGRGGVSRGSMWCGVTRLARCASRVGHSPSHRDPGLGLRLYRSLGDQAGGLASDTLPFGW